MPLTSFLYTHFGHKDKKHLEFRALKWGEKSLQSSNYEYFSFTNSVYVILTPGKQPDGLVSIDDSVTPDCGVNAPGLPGRGMSPSHRGPSGRLHASLFSCQLSSRLLKQVSQDLGSGQFPSQDWGILHPRHKCVFVKFPRQMGDNRWGPCFWPHVTNVSRWVICGAAGLLCVSPRREEGRPSAGISSHGDTWVWGAKAKPHLLHPGVLWDFLSPSWGLASHCLLHTRGPCSVPAPEAVP